MASAQEEAPKGLQDKLELFKQIFSSIEVMDNKMAYTGQTGKGVFELQAVPFIDSTWHALPMAPDSSEIAEDEEVSNWKDYKNRFPTVSDRGHSNVVPCDLKKGKAKSMMPNGVPVNFSKHDRNYERFLAGPPLVKDGKVDIEGPYCHGPSQVSVKVEKNVVSGEKLSRFGLREGQGVSFMLELLKDRMDKVLNADAEWDFYSELKLVAEWIDLICISAFRANAFFSSIQVLLKDVIRSETLNNLRGSDETKKELRLSHFATPKIFGPLSAKFEPYLLPSSHSHQKYLLRTVPKNLSQGKGGFSYDNHRSYSDFSGQQKRSADSSWQSSRGKLAKLARGTSRLVPPQEVFNKSRDATKRFQQNFQRGRGGKQRRFQYHKRGSYK